MSEQEKRAAVLRDPELTREEAERVCAAVERNTPGLDDPAWDGRDKLRLALGAPDGDGERCEKCGRTYAYVWWCHDPFLWEAVTGKGQQPESAEPAGGTWCIPCFAARADDLCLWIEWAPLNVRHLLKPDVEAEVAERKHAGAALSAPQEEGEGPTPHYNARLLMSLEDLIEAEMKAAEEREKGSYPSGGRVRHRCEVEGDIYNFVLRQIRYARSPSAHEAGRCRDALSEDEKARAALTQQSVPEHSGEGETREELALKNRTAEAVANLFGDEDEIRNPYEFRDEVEAKGVKVTLEFPDGGGAEISGADFVNGVWEAIANA